MGERAGEDDAGHVRVDAGRVFRLFPSTQRDLNMGFLLILTQAYHHPTGHLLLITRVIGSEAWVEVKPLEQSEMSTSRTPSTPEGWGMLITIWPQLAWPVLKVAAISH